MEQNTVPGHVLTAIETKDCPPHHYQLDSQDVGTCLKCGAVKDFGPLQRRQGRLPINLAKSREGGHKNLGKLSKKRGRRKFQ